LYEFLIYFHRGMTHPQLGCSRGPVDMEGSCEGAYIE